MVGLGFITSVGLGAVASAAARVGVDIIIQEAVKDVALNGAQKACVFVASIAAESITVDYVYKTVTGRTVEDDVKTIITDLTQKEPKKEEVDSKEEAAVE